MIEREQPSIRDVYARVCADSHYRLGSADAAHFAARLLGVSALEVWTALGTDAMDRIASGKHQPAKEE